MRFLLSRGFSFECTAVSDSHEDQYLAGRHDFRVGVPQNLLFDVHTVKGLMGFKGVLHWRRIPEAPGVESRRRTPFPEAPGIARSILIGMMVDASTRPSTYKLIVGNCHAGTLILNSGSNTWETKPSRMVRCRAPRKSTSPKSCLQCNGYMYIWSESVYSLEEDIWSTLNVPPRHASNEEFRGLGHWQSELYAVTKSEQGTLSVWKLIDPTTQQWSEFERIPSDMVSHLQPGLCCPSLQAMATSFF